MHLAATTLHCYIRTKEACDKLCEKIDYLVNYNETPSPNVRNANSFLEAVIIKSPNSQMTVGDSAVDVESSTVIGDFGLLLMPILGHRKESISGI